MKLSHIENLYRPQAQTILMFRECYALEKIHGTAAGFSFNQSTNELSFQSGGESHSRFVSLFNQEQIIQSIKGMSIPIDQIIEVYGEAYGGSQQGMSHTYGKELKFIVFDVKIGDNFLNVPDAEDVAKKLGLEFVHYVKCSLVKCVNPMRIETNLAEIDAERDAPSVQAKRNGILEDKPREGVVLRPLVEMTLNNGSRVICKHKGDDFKETATPRPVVDPAKLQVLSEASAIANEWVTNTRLEHVLQKLPAPHDMSLIPQLIKAMTEDVLREAEGEIVVSDAAKKAIGKKAVELFKAHLNSQIK
jgi:hypothetical protein